MKKILSLLLALALCLSLVSVAALADGEAETDETAVEEAVETEEPVEAETIETEIPAETEEAVVTEEPAETEKPVEAEEPAEAEAPVEAEKLSEAAAVSVEASNADTTASGTCGSNLTWTLDSEGTLTISGTGAMTDWTSSSSIPWYSYRSSITSVVIGSGVTTIGSSAFSNCTSLTSVTIPDGVTSIGEWAFAWCTGLESVTIPDSVTSIGDFAFWHCTSLTSVTIGSGVTTIGTDAFWHCTSLTSVTIGSGVTTIGDSAFSYCTSLAEISVVSENKYYCSLDGVLFDKAMTTLICCPGGRSGYTIPSSVTIIGIYAFSGCASLESVTIPDSVTTIGEYAFSDCTSLTGVTIPDSVTSIGWNAFYNCTSLTGVTIPDSVTTIGYRAFAYCTSLTSVTIPNSVTEIGGDAFYWCTSLTDVYYGGSETDWAAISIESNNTCLTNATIHYNSTGPDDSESETTYEENYFIKQHLSFLSSSVYTERLNARWAAAIENGLDTTAANVAEGLYNVLNSVSEFASCKALSVFDNPYEPILTDLILSQTDTQAEKFEVNVKIKEIEFLDKLKDLCKKFDENNTYGANDEEFKTKLEKLFADPKDYATTDPVFYKTCNALFGEILEDSGYKAELNELLNIYGKASVLQGLINDYGNVVEWVADCFQYNAMVAAYIGTSDEFKTILNETSAIMLYKSSYLFGDGWYAAEFSSALEEYARFADEDLTEDDIAEMLFEVYFTDGITRIADVFGSAIQKQSVKYLTQGLGYSTASLSWAFAAVEAYKTGWSLSEALTGNGDIMDYRELLRANYYLCEGVEYIVNAYAISLQEEDTYENAKLFDAAWSILQHCEGYSLTTYRAYLEKQNTGFRGAWHWLTGGLFAYDFNAEEFELVDAEIALWEDAICHDPTEVYKGDFGIVKICCPVDVFVYDPDGNLAVSIEDDVVTYCLFGYSASVVDDIKILAVPSSNEHTIKIVATGSGTMSYTETICTTAGKFVQSAYYGYIDIEPDEVYRASYDSSSDDIVLTQNDTVLTADTKVSSEDEIVLVSGITLSDTALSLQAGQTQQLTAQISPADASCQVVHWYSSDSDVVAVSENGLVTANGSGAATIICEAIDGSGIYSECVVEVAGTTSAILGDVTGDGVINVNDVMMLFQYANKQTTKLAFATAADVTGDGVINVNDVMRLFQYANKQITSL